MKYILKKFALSIIFTIITVILSVLLIIFKNITLATFMLITTYFALFCATYN